MADDDALHWTVTVRPGADRYAAGRLVLAALAAAGAVFAVLAAFSLMEYSLAGIAFAARFALALFGGTAVVLFGADWARRLRRGPVRLDYALDGSALALTETARTTRRAEFSRAAITGVRRVNGGLLVIAGARRMRVFCDGELGNRLERGLRPTAKR